MADAHSSSLARLKKHLEELDCDFALVGGLAVGLRTRPRMTKDVDLVVAVSDDQEAEKIVHKLMSSGTYRVQAGDIIEHTGVGRMSTVRLRSRNTDFARPEADLLFASSGIEPEIVEEATLEEFGDVGKVRVATIGHLIATKVLSESEVRGQDRLDLGALLGIAAADDIETARKAVALIMKRGFNRSMDLKKRLAEFIEMFAPELF